MKYFVLIISVLSLFETKGQGMIYVSPKNKAEPFFQKISVVSDIGMSNNFAIAESEEDAYLLRPKMNLGFEVECPRAYFQISANMAEMSPEFKLGAFILEEKVVMYLAFSRQLKPYSKDPEGVFSGGLEGNFDFFRIFKKEEDNHSKFSLSVSPFIEIGTALPNEENWFNFGFVLKPKYHIFVR